MLLFLVAYYFVADRYTNLCICVYVGYISITFTDAVEVSKCYSVNGEKYCFYTSGSVSSWNEAREFCESKNSTLPFITDENIDNVFQQFIVNDVIQNRSVWIDAHARDVDEAVKWHWINGQQSGTDSIVAMLSLGNAIGYVNWCSHIARQMQ